MPNLPMLQNSSNHLSASPIKHATSGTDAGGELQSGGDSFGKVLAREMNGKHDVAEAKPANTNTTSNTDPGDSKDLDGLKNPEGLEKDSGNLRDLKDSETSSTETQGKEAKTDTAAITTVTEPPVMSSTGMLPGPVAAHPLHVPAGVPTPTESQKEMLPGRKPVVPAEARTGVRIDARDAKADTQTDARADIPGEAQIDAGADAPEAKSAATAGRHDAIAVMQPGLAAAHLGKTGTDGAAAMTPTVAGNSPLRTPGILSAAAAAPARAKQAAIGQEIQSEAAFKLELGARRNDLQQMEFSSREFNVAGQTEKSEKSLLDVALKDIGLPNASTALTANPAALAVVAADYSAVPAATGAPVHTALWLEPRVGAAGWDNALGQKVLWMASNQQQVAELNLDPPDLGPLQVTLSINNDQASATFVSQHADVRQALEAALPRLKEMMAESGINLGDATVSAETSQRQGGFEQQHRSGMSQHRGGDSMNASIIKSTDIGTTYTSPGRSRLVDTFA
ncbi:MAG: flagellar hook-length control protein FliK [Nitrosospira sp.]